MFVIKYQIRSLEGNLIAVKAETRQEAINKFFADMAGCFYKEGGSISIDEVINVSALKVID